MSDTLHTTLDGYVTGDACLQYISKDIGILSKCPHGRLTTHESPETIYDCMYIERVYTGSSSTALSRAYTGFHIDIQKLANDKTKRSIGLILGENDDGSFEVAILGNETFASCYSANMSYSYVAIGDSEKNSGSDVWHSDLQPLFVYAGSAEHDIAHITMKDLVSGNDSISQENIFSYSPNFERDTICRGAILNTGRKGNDRYFTHGGQVSLDLQVTNDKTNTLVIGSPFTDNMGIGPWCPFKELAESPYVLLSGSFYDFMDYNHSTILQFFNSFVWGVPGATYNEIVNPRGGIDEGIAQIYEKHSMQTIPVNLILTRNESFALSYLNNGTIPPDAFLFPLDWENLPQDIPTQGDEPEDPSGGDDPDNGETGPSGIDGDPTVDGDPYTTPQKANNNNTYWLQIGQLQSFINWFWTQAGEIIDLESLWERITGLYNDLGSAVLMVRYFPVNKTWIGGTETVNKIIVGMVAQENVSVEKLLKANPQKITIGTQAISPQYNSFADYSPYTELMLYLPFHGWLTLDIDIFMGNSVRVKGIYDYMSGTLQYLIYVVSGNSEYLVNSCVVKMCVDIPITLQSKSDRDSAIFSNVTNAMGNLLGAGASVATMNPIGLVMSTANVANSGTSAAPLKMIGTQGETGAYYAPNKCAIYMKRPSYNRPKLYKSRVGFPCNQGCYLGKGPNDGTPVATGFTTVYNPTIKFSGNSYGGKVIKPLQTEIDEIYDYLEKGVIL